jgi:hypothetical protein
MSNYSDRLEMNLRSQFAKCQSAHDNALPPEYYEGDRDDSISEDQADLMRELHFEGILEARASRERSDW